MLKTADFFNWKEMDTHRLTQNVPFVEKVLNRKSKFKNEIAQHGIIYSQIYQCTQYRYRYILGK